MISDFSKKRLSDTFNGRNSLPIAFWVHFVYGQVIVLLGLVAVTSVLYLFLGRVAENVKVFFYSIAVGYLLFALIGVWRCAFNTKRPVWGYVTRLFVILYAMVTGVGIAQNFNI